MGPVFSAGAITIQVCAFVGIFFNSHEPKHNTADSGFTGEFCCAFCTLAFYFLLAGTLSLAILSSFDRQPFQRTMENGTTPALEVFIWKRKDASF